MTHSMLSDNAFKDFLADAAELADVLEQSLLDLDKQPGDPELIHEAFRCLHTMKGDAGCLGLVQMERLTHAAENLLSPLRENPAAMEATLPQTLLAVVDHLRRLIQHLSAHGNEGEVVADSFITALNWLAETQAESLPEPEAESTPEPVVLFEAEPAAEAILPPAEKAAAREPTAPPTAAAPALHNAPAHHKRPNNKNDFVKVTTERLDRLMDAVGELLVAQSMLLQEPELRQAHNPRLAAKAALLGKITRDLQEVASAMRMVSLKATFQKVERLVHDLSGIARTPTTLTFSGEDTELDRNVVETLRGALVHLVRNAVDHGIENPTDCRKAGKPAQGQLHLEAFHESGKVVVRLRDDGQGLNTEAILSKARRLGLVDENTTPVPAEILQLIFRPGFSTAERVSEISGRGVGLDAVKKSVESLRGRVEVDSTPGAGAVFTIRLPLTLAIVDTMVFRCGQERFLMPSESILEVLRPRPEQLHTVAGQGEMLLLRGALLPMFRLHRMMSVAGAQADPVQALVLVIEGESGHFGLLVDEVLDQQQVVIKALEGPFGHLKELSGGAVLGDGRVALLLDPASLQTMALSAQGEKISHAC